MAKKLYAELTEEERYKANLERLAKLRPIDDILMREMFRGDLELAQLVLRIITGNNDLIVTEEHTQYDMKRLLGSRSICLDVLAKDSEGRIYDLEIQRDDKGASPKRARGHSSGMDVEFLNENDDFDKLKITYVIFITEHDVRGGKRPIYHFMRQDVETGEALNDGTHIMYVNGAYNDPKDKSELAKLIHDFTCSQAKDMYIDLMAKKTRRYKETQKGETRMCKVMEESFAEDIKAAKIESELRTKYQATVKMIKMGLFPLDKIAEGLDLPLEEVKKLAKELGTNPS